MIIDFDEPTAQWLVETFRYAASLWQGDTTEPEEQMEHLVRFHRFQWFTLEPELGQAVFRQLALPGGERLRATIWWSEPIRKWRLRIVQEYGDVETSNVKIVYSNEVSKS